MRKDGRKMSFIKAWKVAGALVKPNELIVAIMCVKHHLSNIIRVHPYLMIPRAEVKFGEEPGAPEFIH